MALVNKFSTYFACAMLLLASMQAFAISDMDITVAVQQKIAANPITATSNINVSTSNGVVSLSGNVMTEKEASNAIEDANSINGVVDVNTNGLMVNDSTQPYQDAYITAKVKGVFIRERLFGDKPISAMTINVETKNGIVYLTGTADNPQQIDTAMSLARGVAGVKGVESKVALQN